MKDVPHPQDNKSTVNTKASNNVLQEIKTILILSHEGMKLKAHSNEY